MSGKNTEKAQSVSIKLDLGLQTSRWQQPHEVLPSNELQGPQNLL